jgi:hypothetical protein
MKTAFQDVTPHSIVDISEELAAFSFILKMEETGFSEMLVNIYHTTWCRIPENSTES